MTFRAGSSMQPLEPAHPPLSPPPTPTGNRRMETIETEEYKKTMKYKRKQIKVTLVPGLLMNKTKAKTIRAK